MTTFHIEFGDIVVFEGRKYVVITIPYWEREAGEQRQVYLQPIENIKACDVRVRRDRFTGEESRWCIQHNRAADNISRSGTQVCVNHVEIRSE